MSNILVEQLLERDNQLTFTLSGLNVSLANAIRRTILSDIPTVVFKTFPYEENKCTILSNTSRFNNEIIKQRLSCIPIHITDLQMPLKDYIMEVNVENNAESIMYVTTEHFKIKNVSKNTYLSETDLRKIFPANDYTGYFIDFVRLRPKLSDELPGEKIHLTCEFGISTAKVDGMFNVASTSSYGFTVDNDKMNEELAKKQQVWRDENRDKEYIEFESKNWKLLDGQRITKKDSFDFIVESVGVYTNHELVEKACHIIIEKLQNINTLIETDDLKIISSQNTIEHCFDVVLVNEDYTIGKILEYMMYSKYFEGLKLLSFCGFKKFHPHDNESIIRIAYKENTEKDIVQQNLKECIHDAVLVFEKIQKQFVK